MENIYSYGHTYNLMYMERFLLPLSHIFHLFPLHGDFIHMHSSPSSYKVPTFFRIFLCDFLVLMVVGYGGNVWNMMRGVECGLSEWRKYVSFNKSISTLVILNGSLAQTHTCTHLLFSYHIINQQGIIINLVLQLAWKIVCVWTWEPRESKGYPANQSQYMIGIQGHYRVGEGKCR